MNTFFNTRCNFGLIFALDGRFSLRGDVDLTCVSISTMVSLTGVLALVMLIPNSDEFCNPITSLCRPKRPLNWGPCIENSQCQSGRCVDGTRMCGVQEGEGEMVGAPVGRTLNATLIDVQPLFVLQRRARVRVVFSTRSANVTTASTSFPRSNANGVICFVVAVT